MQLKLILELINGILENPNRILVISWLFLGSIVAFLYNNNISLQNKLDLSNATTQSLISKQNDNCEEQIKHNRAYFQAQLDNYTNNANMRRDSAENYFYNELRKANQKINQTIIKIQ